MILFTGDLQCSLSNLDKCHLVVADILKYAKKYSVTSVVDLGDAKEAFNPIDWRVIEFLVEATKRIREQGIRYIRLLGNHDRIGTHDGASNILSVLRLAGAEIVTKPCFKRISQQPVGFLPHSYNTETLVANARLLHEQAPTGAVLAFHCEVKGCALNNYAASKEGIPAKALHYQIYKWCFGGHVHKPQVLRKSIVYVGSPMAHDWNEANQEKGYVLYNPVKGSWRRLASRAPGLFDINSAGFDAGRKYKPSDTIRARILCSGKEASFQAAVSRLRQKFKCEILAVPEFEQAVSKEIPLSTSDAGNVSRFVRNTVPDSLSHLDKICCKVVVASLARTGLTPRGFQATRFVQLRAKNYAGFKDLNIRYPRSGLTLVTGWNSDWRCSNGANKTNLLQALLVALFGRTFKGERHDDWVRRHSKGKAFVALRMSVGSRSVVVIRQRRPSRLRLVVDGRDISAGRRPEDVQRDIESLTGLTWQVVSNAIFVDQKEVSSFLFGTDKERFQIVERFQNLERFDAALRDVKVRASNCQSATESTGFEIQKVRSRLRDCKEFITNVATVNLEEAAREFEKADKEFDKVAVRVGASRQLLSQKLQALRVTQREQETAVERVVAKRAALQGRCEVFSEMLDTASQAVGKECPVCHRMVSKGTLKQHMDELRTRLLALNPSLEASKVALEKLRGKVREFERRCSSCNARLSNLENELGDAKRQRGVALARYREAQRASLLVAKYHVRKRKLRRRLVSLKRKRSTLEQAAAILEFTQFVLSRDGLPRYLSESWYPTFAKTAEVFSDLLSDGMLRVRFTRTEDGIKPEVVNLYGGETLKAQSMGEGRLASIATSLALRASGAFNLLVLDEPGEGLDAINAKRFAKGLMTLAQGSNTATLLVTHNEHVAANVQPVQHWKVIKKQGVAKVVS